MAMPSDYGPERNRCLNMSQRYPGSVREPSSQKWVQPVEQHVEQRGRINALVFYSKSVANEGDGRRMHHTIYGNERRVKLIARDVLLCAAGLTG